ncbi:MAG: FadR family transcriptional regulator [Solirubrobacterales bacterium]|nr:FadR family transcriptional regulator [Solirubrobacterales bacterium]MBV9917367.1 FadR family transcriptional regulator [Solirubrobacterales bacterium]
MASSSPSPKRDVPPLPEPAAAPGVPAGPQPAAAPAAPVVAASFRPVPRNPRLADVVAEQLLSSITANHLEPGHRLASERELGEQFDVSRTVIREAIRSLAAKGVLVVRPGSGVHVAAVDAASVSEQMSLFLRGRGEIEYGKINEVRAALEIRTARLAAERARDEDLAELRERCERMAVMEDTESASVEDVEFHRAIAQATYNELFVVMLDSIGDILLEIRRVSLATPGRIAIAVEYHGKILDRITAHDVAGAGAAMEKHLEESNEAWRQATHAQVRAGQ